MLLLCVCLSVCLSVCVCARARVCVRVRVCARARRLLLRFCQTLCPLRVAALKQLVEVQFQPPTLGPKSGRSQPDGQSQRPIQSYRHADVKHEQATCGPSRPVTACACEFVRCVRAHARMHACTQRMWHGCVCGFARVAACSSLHECESGFLCVRACVRACVCRCVSMRACVRLTGRMTSAVLPSLSVSNSATSGASFSGSGPSLSCKRANASEGRAPYWQAHAHK